jgi:hypothetical protein
LMSVGCLGSEPVNERDPWLTEKEAARELRVSAYTVRLERESGRLGYARLRRRIFYPMSEIEAYKRSILHPATNHLATDASASRVQAYSDAARRGREMALQVKEREAARRQKEGPSRSRGRS